MLSGAMGTAGGQGKSPSNKGGKKVSIAPSQPSGKLSGPAMIELEMLKSSAENQKGINLFNDVPDEDQKGAIAIGFVQQ